MKTWAIFSGAAPIAPSSPVASLLANGGGIGRAIGGRPADAWLARHPDETIHLHVKDSTHWNALRPMGIWNSCAQNGDSDPSCYFTTAPADVLTRWFGEKGELCIGHTGTQIVLNRPNPATFPTCYVSYGPYWRRFLLARRPAIPRPTCIEVVISPPDSASEQWPVFFDPVSFSNGAVLAAALAAPAAYLDDPQAFLLPPWDPAQAASEELRAYHAWEPGGPVGLHARAQIRELTGRSLPDREEPFAITLWRAADDLTLRPEILSGAQIEIAGLPKRLGGMGPGTTALLRLPRSASDVISRFRRASVFSDSPVGLANGLHAAFRSDCAEALEPADFTWEEVDYLEAPVLPVLDAAGAGPNPGAPVFVAAGQLETLDQKSGGTLLRGLTNRLLTGTDADSQPLASPAASLFARLQFRPTSKQTFLSAAFWYTFVQFGHSGIEGLVPNELSTRRIRAVTERIRRQESYPAVEALATNPPAWKATVSPEAQRPGHAILHAALMLPAGTRILWGGRAIFNESLTTLDSGAVLG